MKKNLVPTRALLALTLTTALAACGTTTGDRGLSGAGLGAAAGAVGAAVIGGGVATGALVGGAVGAAAGMLTDEEKINLGKPAWK